MWMFEWRERAFHGGKKKLVRKRLGIIDDGMVLRFQWVRYPVKLHNALDHWMPWKLRENESFGGGG